MMRGLKVEKPIKSTNPNWYIFSQKFATLFFVFLLILVLFSVAVLIVIHRTLNGNQTVKLKTASFPFICDYFDYSPSKVWHLNYLFNCFHFEKKNCQRTTSKTVVPSFPTYLFIRFCASKAWDIGAGINDLHIKEVGENGAYFAAPISSKFT